MSILRQTSVLKLSKPAAAQGRLGLPLIAIYGVGGLSEHVVAWGLSNLLLFYLTIICGLSGSSAGFAMGLALVVDAVLQPMVGSLSDNSRSRHGRRHPFMIAGAIPLAVGFGLLYSVPEGLTGLPLFAYAMAMLLVTRIGHAVFNVPYVALGAELTNDYHERSLVTASRLLSGALGAALATWLAYGVFMEGRAGQTHREAYAPLAWSCAAIVAVGAGGSILATLRMRHRLHTSKPVGGPPIRRFAKEIVELFRHRAFRSLFFTALALMVAWGAANSLGLHANTYFWKLKTEQIRNISLMGVGGFVVGCLAAGSLASFIEKRTKAMMGMGLIAACQLCLVPLQLAGLIPPNWALPAVTTASVLAQFGFAFTLVNFQSMTADTADEHEYLFGARREALCYSGSSLAAFASSGLGAMIAGIALDLIGFPHGVPKGAALDLPAETVRNLGLVYGPGAGIVSLLAVACMLGYRLNREKHTAIRDDLAKRRVAEGSAQDLG